MSEQTLNIPQLLAVALIGFFALRWLFSASSSGGDRNNNGGGVGGRGGVASRRGGAGGGAFRVDPAHVDQIQQMFPQLDRRDIMWDLQRNGGNIAATTERVLSGRGLEAPPPSFQPAQPAPAPRSRPAQPSTSRSPPPPVHPDLITRYNLAAKIREQGAASGSMPAAAEAEFGAAQRLGWSTNKDERQALLRKRREDMILAARRKMEEKDRMAT
ncbi:hypothetical protein BDY21DRAFT_290299 [Lineolata rhizophorae]|uniref:Coupling of ubiquitin conjugation to ER degradation protein 1 n=1 Tax=Lineolata rhizophorae TaxID=578093 RepID=A0A6A6NUF8_9PEZI|nr:hypothetical protein BDY21DRAFT_290299 [Lineolata rhizophorae]